MCFGCNNEWSEWVSDDTHSFIYIREYIISLFLEQATILFASRDLALKFYIQSQTQKIFKY